MMLIWTEIDPKMMKPSQKYFIADLYLFYSWENSIVLLFEMGLLF